MQRTYKSLYRGLSMAIAGLLMIAPNAFVAQAQVGGGPTRNEYATRNVRAIGNEEAKLGRDALLKQSFTTQRPTLSISTPSNGGPDDYGYVWSDIGPQWFDATDGQDAGFVGTSYGQEVSVTLPFVFQYYEHTYTSIYIAASGYLKFSDHYATSQPRVPSPAWPNNIIAPLGSNYDFAPQGSSGHVYYRDGIAAGERYFVVQWNDVRGDDPTIGNDDQYTFQVVLFEHGNIDFSYKSISFGQGTSIWCSYAGLEDEEGLDGLTINETNSCLAVNESMVPRTVHFVRPLPTAHLKANPVAQGSFVRANETQKFNVTVKNIGELGLDTYDLFPTSDWTVSFLQADGVSPLSDTDADGQIDIGPLAVGLTKTIVVSVTAPSQINILSHNTVRLELRSSINPSKSKTVNFQAAVPMAFAEIYEDSGLSSSMNMLLQRPSGHTQKFLLSRGYDPVIVELSDDHYFVAWVQSRVVDANNSVYVDEIYYAILDQYGEMTLSPRRLADSASLLIPTAASAYISYGLAVAATDNGHVGLAWSQRIDQRVNNKYLYNDNAYLAVLDNSGSIVMPPSKLTNFSDFAEYNAIDHQRVAKVTLAATDDNRLMTVWGQNYYLAPTATCKSYCWVSNIYAAVNDSNGIVVRLPKQLTDDSVGGDGLDYYNPAVTRLSSARAAVSLERSGDIWVMGLNSNLDTVQPLSQVSTDEYNGYDYSPRLHQAPNGNVVIAWERGNYPLTQIRYALLNSALSLIVVPTDMPNPNDKMGLGYLSIASDKDSNITITAIDQLYVNRQNLYYALLNGNGVQLLSPQIYRTASPYAGYNYGYIAASSNGYGTASYTSPISDTDTVMKLDANLVAGAPGASANIPITVKNYGLNPTSNMLLTMTLDAGLTYLSDTTGVSPTITLQPNRRAPQDRQIVVWALPTLAFLETASFRINVNVPLSQTIGTRTAVQLAISSNGIDGDTSNNANAVQVMASVQTFLPKAMRQ